MQRNAPSPSPTFNSLLKRYADWGFPQKPIQVPKAIWINPLRVAPHICLEELNRIGVVIEQTPFPNSFIVTAGPTLASTLPYLNGWIHIQELSSQLPAYILSPQPGMRVLDIAAAPGNKTTQIASMMNNQGVIVACDPVHERLLKIQNNCARLGVRNVVSYQIDGTYADEILSNADAVLCDVPCSGNLTQVEWARTYEDILSRVPLQKKLLETAVYAAKVDGLIAYSTCSLEIEENEQIIEWALDNLPIQLLPITIPLGHPGLTQRTSVCKRIWPAQDLMGGFFLALLKRKE